MSALAIAKLIYDLIPEKAKETATERFTNSAIDTAQNLWEKLWGKAQGDAKAEKTLKAVEAGDKDKLDRLKIFLEDLMEDNPEFAEELQKLVQEIGEGVKNDVCNNASITFGKSSNSLLCLSISGYKYCKELTLWQWLIIFCQVSNHSVAFC